jgi:hypothetical protein
MKLHQEPFEVAIEPPELLKTPRSSATPELLGGRPTLLAQQLMREEFGYFDGSLQSPTTDTIVRRRMSDTVVAFPLADGVGEF